MSQPRIPAHERGALLASPPRHLAGAWKIEVRRCAPVRGLVLLIDVLGATRVYFAPCCCVSIRDAFIHVTELILMCNMTRSRYQAFSFGAVLLGVLTV